MAETTDAVPALRPSAHRSILRSKSTSDVSTISSDSKSSSITFAPLPDISTRKRRNSRPIGLASRAEMLRRSRGRHYGGPVFEEDRDPRPGDDDDDIPLPDLGKLMKGLWRSVSRKDKGARGAPPAVQEEAGGGVVGAGEEEAGDGKEAVWVEEVAWEGQPPALLSNAVKRDSNRDTMCTVDSGSFLDEDAGTRLALHAPGAAKEHG